MTVVPRYAYATVIPMVAVSDIVDDLNWEGPELWAGLDLAASRWVGVSMDREDLADMLFLNGYTVFPYDEVFTEVRGQGWRFRTDTSREAWAEAVRTEQTDLGFTEWVAQQTNARTFRGVIAKEVAS